MIEKLLEKMNEKKKLKEKAQKRYNSLTLEERNAYEQIIERHRTDSFFLRVPYIFLRLIAEAGIFMIVTCYVLEIEISIFRDAFLALFGLITYMIIPVMIIGILFSLIERARLNKFKLKLLTK